MSDNIIFHPQLQVCQTQVATIFRHLRRITQNIGNEAMSRTVEDIASKLGEPFLFVIVGEVKAGKSSFINALLGTGKDICKVAPDPCTDTVQQIVYGAQEETFSITPHLKKITLPVEILKHIAIVDTPGTNTISAQHQEITERFVPHSDLIVFVFEAKNPYRQSAWEFFDFIHQEWHKKVIFVLQQADLMNPDDLEINRQGVIKQAQSKGIADPKVFAVSAKMEQEGYALHSGFQALRAYIYDNITGGNSYKMKLESNIATGKRILNSVEDGIAVRRQQWQADQQFRNEIHSAMDEQEQKSYQRIDEMVKDLLQDYDRITTNTRHEFAEGLNFFSLAGRSFKSLFSSNEQSVKEWLGDLTRRMEKELQNNFQAKLESRMTDISESIKQMVKIVELKMQTTKTVLTPNHEIFGDIAEKRQDAIKAIQRNYTQFVSETENFVDKQLFPTASNYAPNIAAGGGLALVGAILTASSKAMVFDVTGGIITALGLSLAGATLLFQRRKVLHAFDAEITKGRNALKMVLDEQVKEYTRKIKMRLDHNFDPLDIHLKQESESLANLEQEVKTIEENMLQANDCLMQSLV
ncbi:MAG: dynamin family protein [Sphingobacteriales bacterium]|nr:dynamin family protein [Sphingobacteriales bacterium]